MNYQKSDWLAIGKSNLYHIFIHSISFKNKLLMYINYARISASLILITLLAAFVKVNHPYGIDNFILQDTTLKVTLPPEGKLVKDKPVGKNWINLLRSTTDWNIDQRFWKLEKGELHGDYSGGELHNYTWTKKRIEILS